MGKKIVFLGSDRSGKSSLIQYMKDKLEKEGKSADVIFMGWKNFRNPLLLFFSRMRKEKRENSDDERLKRYRQRSWVFYLFYYSELWLRYFNVLFSRADYVLMDRYFYDELVFASGLKFKVLRLFTPRPHLCLILRASIQDLRKRGIFFSEEKLKGFYRNLYKIEEFCTTLRVDSSRSLPEIYLGVKKQL